MKRVLLLCYFSLFFMQHSLLAETFPVLEKGRFRPFMGNLSLEETQEDPYLQQFYEWQKMRLTPNEIATRLERAFPLFNRLDGIQEGPRLLPSRFKKGHWVSVAALGLQRYDLESRAVVPIENFTPYSNETYQALQRHYREGNREPLEVLLSEAYRSLTGTPIQKGLFYPTFGQLQAERFYERVPLVWISAGLFFIAACGCFYPSLFFSVAFASLSLLLFLRCYILWRPPVANMFETLLYVPWITSVAAIVYSIWKRERLAIVAASIASCVLLFLAKVSQVDGSLDNVQAVLNSQFWLIVHVLMVVGSYGFFLPAAILGHLYLFRYFFRGSKEQSISLILRMLYIGTALLLTGTVLGGIWAAESWGRFWDWDPKESWAFISCATYLMWIHAYRFRHIGAFGLVIGAIVGFQAITFTWYGVNYILGTGLHSYGFGSGGELYYYLFLAVEGGIVAVACMARCSRLSL